MQPVIGLFCIQKLLMTGVPAHAGCVCCPVWCPQQQQLSASELVRTQRQLEAVEGRQAGLARELASLKVSSF
jgi:hypothetical protein